MMRSEDYAKITAKNLKRLFYEAGKTQTQVAKDLGFPQTTVSAWMTGRRTPRMKYIDMLCEYLHCLRSDIMEEHQEQTKEVSAVRIPVYGYIAAGIPLEMIEDRVDWEEIPEDMARRGQFYGLKIRGDSMEPKISSGDVVILRQQDDVESGELAVVSIGNEAATCKRVVKYDNGIALISTNPKYEPMFYTSDQVVKLPVRVLGKVVELRAKF